MAQRPDIRRNDWPGPGDTDVPSYTLGDRKRCHARDSSLDQILDPKKLDDMRRKTLNYKSDLLGPG